MDFDTAWCPVCSRQILPKRYYVPINPPQQAPAVPPSSPTSVGSKVSQSGAARPPRTKTGTIRARGGGGLVHGTGRVKPNGALKRDDTVRPTKKPPTPEAPPAESTTVRPAGGVRHKTVIDQSPIPLYCSDECRLADLQSSFSGIGMEYTPERCTSPNLPPVPHNSFSDFSSSESDSASGASFDSRSSLSCSPPTGSVEERAASASSEAYDALTKLFGPLPPMPPPPPLVRRPTNESTASLDDYQSGVMMAAQRIKAALCPEPPKRRSYMPYPEDERRERKPIPGWTDGSQAWRASVYNMSAPLDPTKPIDEERSRSAYKGFVASSQRSRSGVYSTVSTPTFDAMSPSTTSLPVVAQTTASGMQMRSRSEADELSKYPLYNRRSESRQSLGGAAHLSTSPTGSARSMPVSTSTRRKEFSLVKPGAEGRLLVPDVKMARTSSTTTMSSVTSGGSSWGVCPGRKPSPLSRQNSDASIETSNSIDTEADAMRGWSTSPTKKSPTCSWSYSDDTLTYPILQIPKKEKRIERRIVDGKEQDVEVEVEVHAPLKRLFLFPGKDGR